MSMFGNPGSNYPPGVTGNEPELTGEWPCPNDCEAGLDGDSTCGVCEGKGYMDGTETYLDQTFVCSECDGKVTLDPNDPEIFVCARCSTRFTTVNIGLGDLEVSDAKSV